MAKTVAFSSSDFPAAANGFQHGAHLAVDNDDDDIDDGGRTDTPRLIVNVIKM